LATAPGSTATGTAKARLLNDINQHRAQSYIEPLVTAGIFNGYPDSSFKPDNSISRAEFVHIITLALNLPAAEAHTAFKDWDNTEPWTRAGIDAAVQADIINGFDDGIFRPE
jgi:hypothetical protein